MSCHYGAGQGFGYTTCKDCGERYYQPLHGPGEHKPLHGPGEHITPKVEAQIQLTNEIVQELIDEEEKLKEIRNQANPSDEVKFLLRMLDEAQDYIDDLRERMRKGKGD